MPRHGKQYSVWSSIVEIVGPITDWPVKIRKLFWTKHISNFQRLILATFIFVNGLNPELIKDWISVGINLFRDKEAEKHIFYLIEQFEKQNHRYTKYYNYNVTHNRYEHVDGTIR